MFFLGQLWAPTRSNPRLCSKRRTPTRFISCRRYIKIRRASKATHFIFKLLTEVTTIKTYLKEMKGTIYFAVVSFLAIVSSPSTVSGSNMIMEVLNTRPDRYSMLIQSMQAIGLADMLQKGEVTYNNSSCIHCCQCKCCMYMY